MSIQFQTLISTVKLRSNFHYNLSTITTPKPGINEQRPSTTIEAVYLLNLEITPHCYKSENESPLLSILYCTTWDGNCLLSESV